jgi:hypothetical protein
MRRSIVPFIDPVSPVAFVWAVPTRHARHPARALGWGLSPPSPGPRTLSLGQRSEFGADCARAFSPARSRSLLGTTARHSSSRTLPFSTGNSPTDASSPTPSAPITPSAKNLRDPSSSNTNLSAKGTGLNTPTCASNRFTLWCRWSTEWTRQSLSLRRGRKVRAPRTRVPGNAWET